MLRFIRYIRIWIYLFYTNINSFAICEKKIKNFGEKKQKQKNFCGVDQSINETFG